MPQDGQVPSSPALRRPAVPSAVLAMLFIVCMEAMFFAGLISAFLIVKAGIKPGMWPPPWQPRLPVEATAINTGVLVVSGVLLLVASLRALRKTEVASRWLYLAAAVLGASFVAFQGFEWTRLLSQGLTMTSSNHGAFFYLIVGTHALHVMAGLLALLWGLKRLWRGALTKAQLTAVQIFWTFVVALWPLLYALVYL